MTNKPEIFINKQFWRYGKMFIIIWLICGMIAAPLGFRQLRKISTRGEYLDSIVVDSVITIIYFCFGPIGLIWVFQDRGGI